MRLPAFVAIAAGLAGGALAQSTTPASPTGAREAEETGWDLALSAAGYLVPDSRDYVQPTIEADRGRLHLEARYSYEDRDTGSAWIGCNLAAGDALTLELTPMLGAVFGNTTGIAPGYHVTLGWRKLELYTEGEYVFDTGDSSDSFFYTWSELSLAPADWLRFGAVVDRTKLYRTEFEIQRGFLVGLSWERVDFTAYVFNPDVTPTVVLGFGLSL